MRLRQESSDREGAAATDAGSDAVRILTIHGSKGLEFPVVFVADLSGPTSRCADPFLVQPQSVGGEIAPVVGLKLPKIAPYDGAATIQHVRFAKELEAREIEEEKRCLYVACTRAEELLVISGARALQKAPEGGYLIDWIRSALGDPQDDGLVQVADSEVAVTVLRPEAGEPDDIAMTALDADAPIYAPSPPPDRAPSERHSPQTVSYTALHRFDACQFSYYVRYILGLRDSSPARDSDSAEFGVALHQALEGVIGGGDRGVVLAAVTRRHSLVQAQCERLKSAVDGFLASEVGVRALEGYSVAREQALRVPLGDTSLVGSIDLISWNGDEALVVDYKTGKSPEQSPSRLAGYRLQADCYALGAIRAGASKVSVNFVFVEHDAFTLAFEFTVGDAEGIAAGIEERLELIRGGRFPHLDAFDVAVCGECPALGGICPVDDPRRS